MIYDGSDDKAMLIGEAYGNSNNMQWKSISSTFRTMFIVFQKLKNNDGPTIAEVRVKYNTFIPQCQNWFDKKNNTLKSPNKYDNNLNCTWLFSYNFGSYIKLKFDYIHVSSTFNILTNFISAFKETFMIFSLKNIPSLRMNFFKYMMVEANIQT